MPISTIRRAASQRARLFLDDDAVRLTARRILVILETPTWRVAESVVQDMKRKILVSLILTLTLTVLISGIAIAAPKLVLPKSVKVTNGFGVILELAATGGAALPDDIVFSVKNRKICSVDENGAAQGLKVGTTYVYAKSDSWGKKNGVAKCKVKVVKNAYKNNSPYKGSSRTIYTSTRRVYKKGNYIYGEGYLYNRLGKTIAYIRNVRGTLYDTNTGNALTYTQAKTKWKPSGGRLGNKKTGKISFKYPLTPELNALLLRGGNVRLSVSLSLYDVYIWVRVRKGTELGPEAEMRIGDALATAD